MSQSIRVLIGDDSLELGISWATAFKEAGLYAITRPKMGKVLVDYVLTERPAVVILDAKTPGLDLRYNQDTQRKRRICSCYIRNGEL